jgi:predicted histidine transporter YuiF (NhaC family)
MKILALIGFIAFIMILLAIFAAVLLSSHKIDDVDED